MGGLIATLLLGYIVKGQVAGFTYSQPNLCSPSTVYFTNTSTVGYTTLSWNFGDGSSPIAIANPTHPYTNAGTYVVELTATYPNGTKTHKDTIYVYQKPVFNFSKLNDSLCSGDSVHFTASITYPSAANIVSYSWNFGDGLSSSLSTPSHSYSKDTISRTYTVSLTIVDNHGCSDIVTKNNYVTIFAPPVVNFTADKTSFCQPPIPTWGSVNFTNLTSNLNDNTYQWDLGNGAFSTFINATQTYIAPANAKFSVKLVATSPMGCKDSLIKTNYIDFHIFTSQFDVSKQNDCDVLETFVRGLNGNGTDYKWYFGDGDSASTRSEIIPHTYNTPGDYVLIVYATSAEGCQDVDTVQITVYDSHIAASMYASDTAWCDPNQVLILKNTTTYPYADNFGLTTVKWLLNDTVVLTGDSVSYVYNKFTYSGQDVISMIVTTPYGCTLDTVRHYVQIMDFLLNLFNVDIEPCIPNGSATVKVDISSTSTITKSIIYWNSPDTTDFTLLPTNVMDFTDSIFHAYPQMGRYYIKLHIENADSCSRDLQYPVDIGGKPLVNVDFEYMESCYNQSVIVVTAYDSLNGDGSLASPDSVKATHWQWYNDDRHILSIVNPAEIYPEKIGYFGVKLLAFNNGCPSDTISIDTLGYACPPLAQIEKPRQYYPRTPFCDTSIIGFESSSILPTQIWWWYGDTSVPYTGSHSGWIAPDSIATFDYLASGGSYIYSDSGGKVDIILIAVNNDTNPNSPTYNPCGYCADTVNVKIVISLADPNTYPTFLEHQCQNVPILFYDSTTSNDGMESWGIRVGYQYIASFSNRDVLQTTQTLNADSTGTIAGYIFNRSKGGCYREYPFTIRTYPTSTPAFYSSKDSVNFHYITESICTNNPDTLYFIDTSYTKSPFDTMAIISYRWKIYVDTISVIDTACKNLTLIDTFSGIQNVKLSIINEAGCESELNANAYIIANKVIPSFISDANAHCDDKPIGFISTSQIFPLEMRDYSQISYTWDFGDGSPTQTYYTPDGWTAPPTVYHTYGTSSSLNDEYLVTLTVNIVGVPCSASVTDTVRTHKVEAYFTDNGHHYPCPGDVGRNITFTDSSTGGIVWWSWNFGDTISGSSNEVFGDNKSTIEHIYTRSGNYTIRLIVRDSIGCTDTLIADNHVFIDGPQGNFTYSPYQGCLDLPVTFVPNIISADTIMINPDGGTMLEQWGANMNDTVDFTYTQPYPYVPYFYLIQWVNNQGTMERCVVEWRGNDTVYPMRLEVDFETNNPYCSQNLINFANTIKLTPDVGIDTILWDFGNGITNTQPFIQYDVVNDSKYTVCVRVNAKSCDTVVCKEIEIMALPQRVTFTPDSAGFCDSKEIDFFADTAFDMSDAINYQWTFADGFKTTGYPGKRTFSQSDTYPYIVRVDYGINENCWQEYYDTFKFILFPKPTANFDANVWEALPEEPIQFTDLSTFINPLIRWNWNFGDGDSSNTQNPSHAYSKSGYFTINLLIEDQNGCQDTTSQQVVIKELFSFPNVFTPDAGDGTQYRFRPLEDKGTFNEFSIVIYDRWGVEVWKQKCQEPDCPSKNDDFWWNGNNKQGNRVADGVYFWSVYAVPITDSQTLILNGSVTVMSGK
ncbi:MAG: PKD domain-containing protein [Bacteroidales bacterium]|nr:PKD domain-containing protein [Bacteroidales bacterium]